MIRIIRNPITLAELRQEAEEVFGDMVKTVVDVEKQILAINGELHADEEQVLLEKGSKQADLWGINLYPSLHGTTDWLEYDSMINLRPSGGNKSRGVENPLVQKKIREIIDNMVIS